MSDQNLFPKKTALVLAFQFSLFHKVYKQLTVLCHFSKCHFLTFVYVSFFLFLCSHQIIMEANFSEAINIDPCNQSTILFLCNHPAEWIKFFGKILVLLPLSYLCVFFIKESMVTNNHIIKTEILFCITSALYLIIYFWTENAIPYENLNVTDSSIYRYNQIPLFYWFLCQASYISEISDVLIFLKIPFAKYIKHIVTFLKYVCILFVLFVTICMLLPYQLNGGFFDGLFQKNFRWDSPVFYFIHSLMIIVLSATFVFFPRAASMFPQQHRKKMLLVIFLYALALALDLIAFELSHTIFYYFNLYWSNRNTYLYIHLLMQFFYYDFPPLIMAWIVYMLAFPSTVEEETKNIRDMLTSEFDI